jgi:hypothetical protein
MATGPRVLTGADLLATSSTTTPTSLPRSPAKLPAAA